MKAVLLIAHGSRRSASNDEVRAVAGKLAEVARERFQHVQCGFLELADPDIATGIQQCIDAGAREILVLPYFLAAGRHLQQDIPAQVAAKAALHPDVLIRITDYLGASPGIPELLLGLLDRKPSPLQTGFDKSSGLP